jgi:hypothetical protein
MMYAGTDAPSFLRQSFPVFEPHWPGVSKPEIQHEVCPRTGRHNGKGSTPYGRISNEEQVVKDS